MDILKSRRLKKMKSCFRAGDYNQASLEADKLDPAEIKTAYDLSMMADVYITVNHYGAAKKVYTEIYRRSRTSRNCKKLIDLSIRTKDIRQAVSYLNELKNIDGNDYEIYVFQYRIGKLTNQSDESLINSLQKVREADYVDVWALELAKLYLKTGMNEECINECKNLKLWFPQTMYAEKADILQAAAESGAPYSEVEEYVVDESGFNLDDFAKKSNDRRLDDRLGRVLNGEEYDESDGYDDEVGESDLFSEEELADLREDEVSGFDDDLTGVIEEEEASGFDDDLTGLLDEEVSDSEDDDLSGLIDEGELTEITADDDLSEIAEITGITADSADVNNIELTEITADSDEDSEIAEEEISIDEAEADDDDEIGSEDDDEIGSEDSDEIGSEDNDEIDLDEIDLPDLQLDDEEDETIPDEFEGIEELGANDDDDDDDDDEISPEEFMRLKAAREAAHKAEAIDENLDDSENSDEDSESDEDLDIEGDLDLDDNLLAEITSDLEDEADEEEVAGLDIDIDLDLSGVFDEDESETNADEGEIGETKDEIDESDESDEDDVALASYEDEDEIAAPAGKVFDDDDDDDDDDDEISPEEYMRLKAQREAEEAAAREAAKIAEANLAMARGELEELGAGDYDDTPMVEEEENFDPTIDLSPIIDELDNMYDGIPELGADDVQKVMNNPYSDIDDEIGLTNESGLARDVEELEFEELEEGFREEERETEEDEITARAGRTSDDDDDDDDDDEISYEEFIKRKAKGSALHETLINDRLSDSVLAALEKGEVAEDKIDNVLQSMIEEDGR